MGDLPTGRLTLLFTDIEGSTRLVARLGDGYTGLLEDHNRLLRGSFAAHGGSEVSTTGDSFFVVFAVADDAVQAAAAAQRELAGHEWPDGCEVRVRMGIHSGHAVRIGDDYVGIDVNRTARIADAANGGQILLSEAASSALAGTLPPDLATIDLGRHRLKDVGVEHLWGIHIDGLVDDARPPRSIEAHPTNLPLEPTSLVDRERERRELISAVTSAGLVTITGPGGIGKSRVAIQVARESIDSFPDGVFYLDLAALDDAERTVSELAAVLGIRQSPAEDPRRQLLDHLRDRRLLVVFDTGDRVGGLADLLGSIAGNCPETRVVLTSRSPVHISAEYEYPMGPLAFDRSETTDGHPPAVALFLDRARAVRPDVRIDEGDVAAIEEICARLDGLPLAIELAAARVRILSPTAILGRLTRLLPILVGGAADAPARQRTLRDTIAWSYGLLEQQEQTVLQRLSVFAGSFDLAACEAVGAPPGEALSILEQLADRSLLTTVSPPGEVRFRLLLTIREFALEALEASGQAEGAREAHAGHVLDIARAAVGVIGGPDETEALARLERDRGDIHAALDWTVESAATEAGRADLAIALAGTLGRFWWIKGHAREGAVQLERAIGVGPVADREAWARALHWSGILLDDLGQAEKASARLEAALEVRRGLPDPLAVARTLNSLGVVARSLGDVERARSLLAESLAMKRALEARDELPSTLSNLGILAADEGRYDEAIELFEEALRIDEASGGVHGQAFSRLSLGAARIMAGDDEGGSRDIELVLPIVAQLETPDAIADGLEALAETAMHTDRTPRAARLLLSASAIRERESVPLRPLDQVRIDRLMASIESSLDPDELDAARADAGAMDIPAAVRYGLADG